MKRIIAGLLCATMLFSMDGYRSVSYAAGPDSYYSVEASSETSIEEDESTHLSTINPDGKENNEEREEGAAGASASSSASSQEATVETTEDSSEAATLASSTDASDEATSLDSEEKEASDESSSLDSESEDAADAASSESSEEAENLFKGLNEGKIKAASTRSITSKASECFGVDEEGKLFLKEGRSLSNSVVIPAEATIIPAEIFKGDTVCTIVLFEDNSNLTTIEAGAFEQSSVANITIPKGVTEIKDNTFKNATDLNRVSFENNGINITRIGSEAFSNTDIKSLSIPNVTEIGNSAFSGCSNLSGVSVGKLETIGRFAFANCTSLTSMTFPMSVSTIGNSAFVGCSKISSIDLGDKVNNKRAELTLGDNCFQNATGLTKVELPDSLIAIPRKAFSGCTKLNSISVGQGTLVIGNNAFEKCALLDTVVFFNVETFSARAFDGCGSLKTIYIRTRKTKAQGLSIDEEAFPLKSGVTMYGYTEDVQDYAEKRGYTFEDLAPRYSLGGIIVGGSGSYTFTSSSNGQKIYQAREDEIVLLNVTCANGYELSGISIKESIPVSSSDIQLVENTPQKQVFSFKMPKGDVKAEINMVKKGESTEGDLDYYLVGLNDYSPAPVGDYQTFDISGREAQLVVKDGNGETNSWLWNFTSSNAKIATVSSLGVIRTTGKGKVTITATLKSNTKKKVTVPIEVKGTANVGNVELVIPDSVSRGAVIKEAVDSQKRNTITVVQYEKSALLNGSKSFNVSIKAYSGDENVSSNLVVKSTWSSTDKAIASVVANSSTNTNTITVNKGAVGETLITVSVLNEGQKTPSEENTKSFIVRVVDATPRLESVNVTVDSNSTTGTALDIKTVYGYTIAGDLLELCTRTKDKKGVITYEPFTDLDIYCMNDIYYLVNGDPSTPFAKTYSGATQLYLKGNYYSDSRKGETFYIPIPKVTVTNKALNPALKVTGKINLFYNYKADASVAGKVTVNQSLGNLTVDHVKLVSVANFKKDGSEYPDSFAENFDIENIDDRNFEITRSSSELVKVNNRNVTSGYIYIYYDGYSAPVKKPISVPTCDVAPDYVLNNASATASIYSKDQRYELQLVDKKTKKIVTDLSTLDVGESDSGNIIGLGLDSSTTEDLFKDLDTNDVNDARANDKIVLTVDGTPRKGVASIYVRMTTWSRTLTYKFNLNVSGALPTVKLSTGTATLNKTYKGQSAIIKLTQNQPEAKLVGGEITYAGAAKFAADAKLLRDAMKYDEDTVVISIPKDSNIAKTTYRFKIVPAVTYDGVEVLDTKVQYFNVVVNETQPTIKLSNATFKLNSDTPGVEEVIRTYTIGNLPTGVTGTIENGTSSDVATNDEKARPSGYTIEPVGTAPAFDKLGTLEFKDGKAIAKLNNNSIVKLNSGKTLRYTVKNLSVKCDSEDSADIPAFTINVQLNKTAPSVRVAAKGTINPVDRTSAITYTSTVSNIESDIENVSVWEKDDVNNYWKDKATGNYYSKHFKIVMDDNNSKIAYLMAKDGEDLVNNKKYNITVVYTLKATPGKTYKANFTVVPKQTLPQITVDKTTAIIYSGQTDRYGKANRTVKIKITQKTSNINAEMTTPVFAKGTPANIDKAFDITDFDPETGIMTLELVNPSALVQNSTYTLNFETTYKNQAQGSVGNKFALKVTIKK